MDNQDCLHVLEAQLVLFTRFRTLSSFLCAKTPVNPIGWRIQSLFEEVSVPLTMLQANILTNLNARSSQ